MRFKVGRKYTRPQVFELCTGSQTIRTEGVWNRGWILFEGHGIIFANIGVAGHGGYDYPNQWIGNRLVWETTKPRPRWFLRVLYDLLQLGKDERMKVIDDSFIRPKLQRLIASVRTGEPETETQGDDRLA